MERTLATSDVMFCDNRLIDRVHVVRQTAHQFARRVLVEKAQRQRLQMSKEVAPQLL